MATLKHRHADRHHDLYKDVVKIKDALNDVTHNLRGKAGEMFSDSVDDIREKSTNAKDAVGNYTSERPFKSLGVALLAGIVLGYFLHK